MQLTYLFNGERIRLESLDERGQDVELRHVYEGLTLITDDGERLSVCMRDSGFEVHYYSDEDDEGKGFDLGWFEFKAGTAGISDSIVEATLSNMPEGRQNAWLRATVIVEKMLEDITLAPYRAGAPFGPGSTVTVAEQKLSLIRDVADWLLGID